MHTFLASQVQRMRRCCKNSIRSTKKILSMRRRRDAKRPSSYAITRGLSNTKPLTWERRTWTWWDQMEWSVYWKTHPWLSYENSLVPIQSLYLDGLFSELFFGLISLFRKQDARIDTVEVIIFYNEIAYYRTFRNPSLNVSNLHPKTCVVSYFSRW